MSNKAAITTQNLDPIIQNRWSPRAFQADKSVSGADLTALLEAAHWAPSCMNEQPWRFIVCDKTTHPDSWEKLLNCLMAKNQLWASQAPVLILASAAQHFSNSDKANAWAAYDTGAAVQNLALQATALGLSTHSMGGFDSALVISQFGLSETVKPLAVIAVGYQADVSVLAEEFQEKELATRQRHPLETRVQFG
jgi:nitroreductase